MDEKVYLAFEAFAADGATERLALAESGARVVGVGVATGIVVVITSRNVGDLQR